MHVRGLRRRPPSCTDALAMILIHACARIAIQDIPKDCRGRCYFNSYMRKDCNEGPGMGGVSGVLIHACARIATVFCFVVLRPIYISIHACARIATNRGFQGAEPPLFRFMHARGLQLLMDYTIKQVTGTF